MISKPAIMRPVQVQDTGNELEIETMETKTTLYMQRMQYQNLMGKNPHMNYKPKIYNRYTDIKKKNESKHSTKVIHQITREDNKRRREEKKTFKKEPKTIHHGIVLSH